MQLWNLTQTKIVQSNVAQEFIVVVMVKNEKMVILTMVVGMMTVEVDVMKFWNSGVVWNVASCDAD